MSGLFLADLPYYRLVFGQTEPRVMEKSGTATIHPADSQQYDPIIVRTDDDNQCFIIENRRSEGDASQYEGVNIWRIDKVGAEAIFNQARRGISLDAVLSRPGDTMQLNYYANSADINDVNETYAGVNVTVLSVNADGTITIDIESDHA